MVLEKQFWSLSALFLLIEPFTEMFKFTWLICILKLFWFDVDVF